MQGFDVGSGTAIIIRARGDPGEEGPGFDRVMGKPQAAFVGDGPSRLEDNQARFRSDPTDPPAGLVVSEGLKIERRVFAPQAQFEAPFAVEITMARPHVAAGLGEQRGDVGAEAGRAPPVSGVRTGRLRTQRGQCKDNAQDPREAPVRQKAIARFRRSMDGTVWPSPDVAENLHDVCDS